ncbi:MAG: transcriptional regulator [Candidatus Hydrogenedentes bacterium]|nr:transcriptional regulator [Candidatus Hydrogenedentota bacterium]
MTDLDRTIHEPARLRILTLLSGVDAVDFNFLLSTLGLTKGNLSSHMDKLERVGYVEVEKSFNGRIPHTEFRITGEGRSALREYWQGIDAIRAMRDLPERGDTAPESPPGEPERS